MGNQLTSELPADVDSFLMDIAQMVELEGESIDYSQIDAFAKRASEEQIAEMRENIADLYDLGFNFDEMDEDTEEALSNVYELVKGETHDA